MAYQLKEEYVRKIYDDPILIGKIAAAAEVRLHSVLRWLDTGDDQMTKYCVLYTIANHLNVNRIDSLVKLQLSDKRKKANTTSQASQ
jgi:hypothetical protein